MVAHNNTFNFTQQPVWQQNCHKRFLANALLEKDAIKQPKLPIILITEPYCIKGRAAFSAAGYTTFSVNANKLGLNPRAAIAIPTYFNALQKFSATNRDTTTVIIKDSSRTICLVSAYLDIKFNNPIASQALRNAVFESERSGWNLLVGCDANAHSLLWGSATPNTRGGLVEEFLATNDLAIKNIGNEFTFVNSQQHKTIIDITFTNRSLEYNIANWAVNTKDSYSDHKRIEYTIDFESVRTIEARNYSQGNWTLFNSIVTRKIEQPDPNLKWDGPRLDREAEKFEQTVNYALNATCPNKTIKLGVNKPRSADWFQPETQRLSNLVKKLARELRKNPTTDSRARHVDAKRQLQNNIRANQRECSANLCANITDMKSFSNYTKSLTGSKAPPIGMLEDPVTSLETNTVDDVARVLLNQHLPGSVTPNPNPNPKHRTKKSKPQEVDLEAEDLKWITVNKLSEAFRLFGSHKSPGPDNFKPIVLHRGRQDHLFFDLKSNQSLDLFY
jgi:hypothetical protein